MGTPIDVSWTDYAAKAGHTAMPDITTPADAPLHPEASISPYDHVVMLAPDGPG